MKVNCLSCGHKIYLDDGYDDYTGQIKCLTCQALLEIKADQGNLKSVKFLKIAPRRPSIKIGGVAEQAV